MGATWTANGIPLYNDFPSLLSKRFPLLPAPRRQPLHSSSLVVQALEFYLLSPLLLSSPLIKTKDCVQGSCRIWKLGKDWGRIVWGRLDIAIADSNKDIRSGLPIICKLSC
ncbi:hypothetical protein ACLOJK_023682 [Asimina triloba]